MKCITLEVLSWAGALRRDFETFFLDNVIVASATPFLSDSVTYELH